jgi:hypothetical protein
VTNVPENIEFRAAKRGFEPADVDRAFAQITSRIANAQELRDEAEKDIERLSRELNEARLAVKRANSKPTFSDLGAAFEQTLRVAEEQAGKLLQDASEEVATVRDSAKADAERIQVSSERQAHKLLAEAEKRSEKVLEDSTRRSVDLVADAEAQLEAANLALSVAAKAIAAIEKKAAADTREIMDNAKLETEQARREMATLRDLQSRDQLRIEREVAVTREKAQRENERLAEETSAFIAEILADAQLQVAEADRKAEQLIGAADSLSGKAHQDADALRRGSQATAAGIISRAQERAQTLNNQTFEYKTKVLAEAAMTIANLEDARLRILDFNGELAAMDTVDDSSLSV